ncbi:DUF4245 domain-containing protein [Dermacoccaceae bacterium W4C1]
MSQQSGASDAPQREPDVEGARDVQAQPEAAVDQADEAQAPAPTGQQPPARRRGMGGTARNMILSMIVVIVGAFVWLALVPRTSTVPQREVGDPNGIAREVAISTKWDVALPQKLPQGWSPVNVQLVQFSNEPQSWHAGYKAPSGDFAALDQTPESTPPWLRGRTAQGTRDGQVSIAGVTWDKYVAGDRRALVRSSELGGLATIVSGEASWQELQTFAAALQPRSAIAAASATS